MAVTERNRQRYRAILVSRQVKWLFGGVPERFARRILGRFLLGPLLRWLFLTENGELHRAGEIVLAELRNRFAPPARSHFSPDALVMARRAGQREVFDALINLLNLDERTVHQLMEIDDGLE